MTTPTTYERVYNFTNYQTQSPADPLPGAQVDAELNAVKNSLDETQASLAMIQRADGQIANDSVGLDQLKAEVEIGVNPPSAWVTLTNYAVAETVTFEAGFYRCLIAHVSGTFATDLAAAKWELIVDFSSAISESSIQDTLHNADSKADPVDADEFMGNDSADSYTLRRFTWANIKAGMFSAWGALINSGTGKTTPVDADALALMDSAAANATKKVTFANLKAAVYSALGATVAALTGKTTPVDADTFAISDSAASDVAKKVTFANLKATIFSGWGALIAAATGKTTPADADTLLLSDSAASDATKKLTIANLKAWALSLLSTATLAAKLDLSNAAAGQIKFPASQNASTDPNTLDDYEEGTSTPTPTANSGSFTSASCSLRYTKIGNQVTVSGTLTVTTLGTAAGFFNVPAPFTNGPATCVGSATIGVGVSGWSQIGSGGSFIQLGKYDATSPGGTTNFSITYFV